MFLWLPQKWWMNVQISSFHKLKIKLPISNWSTKRHLIWKQIKGIRDLWKNKECTIQKFFRILKRKKHEFPLIDSVNFLLSLVKQFLVFVYLLMFPFAIKQFCVINSHYVCKKVDVFTQKNNFVNLIVVTWLKTQNLVHLNLL